MLFKLVDEDKNNMLDKAEFKKALRLIGISPSPQELSKFFHLKTQSQSEQLSFDEFRAFVQEQVFASYLHDFEIEELLERDFRPYRLVSSKVTLDQLR